MRRAIRRPATLGRRRVFGALNGNLLVAPRELYAMGEDGMAPPAQGKIHPAYRMLAP